MSTTPPSEPRPPESSSPAVPSSPGSSPTSLPAAAPMVRRPRDFPELSDSHLHSQPRRRRVIPLLLFVATCLSTYWVGAADWKPQQFGTFDQMWEVMTTNWEQGLVYMGCVV